MPSVNKGPELIVRETTCQDFMTTTKTIVQAAATVAAPLKLSISISNYTRFRPCITAYPALGYATVTQVTLAVSGTGTAPHFQVQFSLNAL